MTRRFACKMTTFECSCHAMLLPGVVETTWSAATCCRLYMGHQRQLLTTALVPLRESVVYKPSSWDRANCCSCYDTVCAVPASLWSERYSDSDKGGIRGSHLRQSYAVICLKRRVAD